MFYLNAFVSNFQCEFGPDRYLPDKELSALMRVLEKVQHPNIPASVLSSANESGGIVIRPCYEKGTLRDLICKCKPRGHYLKKYASPGKTQALDLPPIKLFGKQILETLNLLHEKGLPYGKLTYLQAYSVDELWYMLSLFSANNVLCRLCKVYENETCTFENRLVSMKYVCIKQ